MSTENCLLSEQAKICCWGQCFFFSMTHSKHRNRSKKKRHTWLLREGAPNTQEERWRVFGYLAVWCCLVLVALGHQPVFSQNVRRTGCPGWPRTGMIFFFWRPRTACPATIWKARAGGGAGGVVGLGASFRGWLEEMGNVMQNGFAWFVGRCGTKMYQIQMWPTKSDLLVCHEWIVNPPAPGSMYFSGTGGSGLLDRSVEALKRWI